MMNSKPGYWKIFVIALALLTINNLLQAQTTGKIILDKNAFGAIEARHIGPATMSGRISALDAVQNDPRIIYAGSASGGLWKSTNGGVQFKPVFDRHSQSIGAIAIDQVRPDTVWVGTGEVWVRNSVSVGDGIYRTCNGGETWEKMGLENTERIGKIIIHPTNPDIIFVAALGHLWSSNEERGVFKTLDGGVNWEKILYIDHNTGCADLAIDNENPDIIYAAMWEFRRYPWFFDSGGKGSGLFSSRDGGITWSKVNFGLSDEKLGRIALSVSKANPDIVYALVESQKTALYKSFDKGINWQKMSDSPVIGERPFYFSMIVADPVDTAIVYKPGLFLYVSKNGGKTFRTSYVTGGNVHPDIHPLWISEEDNNMLLMGTDGGLYVSNDRGSAWRHFRNLPVSQFYHVAVDNQNPYNVYGGLQDNGSWMGPSKSPGGIKNRNWSNVGGGDGFYVFPDPNDENILYWQYQGGNIYRRYMETGESKEIKPYDSPDGSELRFNWDTPVAFSPSGDIMYLGSQYLFKSTDRGDSWTAISPDLSTNDPDKLRQHESGGITLDNSTAENHCTIYSISESPVKSGVIWVGTDDGNLHLTKNNGQNWNNVVASITGLPPNTWVSSVYASRFDEATAYVTFDGHRQGDMKPYIYKTTDYGSTWVNLADQNIEGWCHKILEDTKNPNLLFLGTELGLFISIDNGSHWSRFEGKIPRVSVMDMVIQERENDLVLATHGRGILIIDDITALRHLTQEVLAQEVAFLPSKSYQIGYLGWEMDFSGDDEFTGNNPQDASIITYYLKKRHIFGNMSLEIYNAQGELIKELPAGNRKGINKVTWHMRMKPPRVPRSPLLAFNTMYGPTYPPGEYTVKLLKGDDVFESKINIGYDPSMPHATDDRNKRMELIMESYQLLEDLAFLDHQATEIIKQAKDKSTVVKNKTLLKSLHELEQDMDQIHQELVTTKLSRGITVEEKLREKIGAVYGAAMGYQGAPTQSQMNRLATLKSEFRNKRDHVDKVIHEQLPAINQKLAKTGVDAFVLITKTEFREKF